MTSPDEPLDEIAHRLSHALESLRAFSETLGDGPDPGLRAEAQRLVADISVHLRDLLDQLGML